MSSQLVCNKDLHVYSSLVFVEGKDKSKVHSRNDHESPEVEYRYSSTLTLTSALDGGGWSTPCPGRFIPGKDQVPIVQEAGWAPGTVWKDAEHRGSTGIRFPDHPARNESLYRLSYLDLRYFCYGGQIMATIDKTR
jgi:hypothetical protein